MKEQQTPYEIHVFVCNNMKTSTSCGHRGGQHVVEKLKAIGRERGWKPAIRVSRSGCLGQCAAGPNIMIYPTETWFSGVQLDTLDEVVDYIENLRTRT